MCTVFAFEGYQFYHCEATVVKLMKFKTYCINNQQVCIHVCQHILLFKVLHYLYCVHLYNVIFYTNVRQGGCIKLQDRVGPRRPFFSNQ